MAEKSNRIYLLEEADVASALFKLGIPTMVGMLIIDFSRLSTMEFFVFRKT